MPACDTVLCSGKPNFCCRKSSCGSKASSCESKRRACACLNDRCDKRRVKYYVYSRWNKNPSSCEPTYACTTRNYKMANLGNR